MLQHVAHEILGTLNPLLKDAGYRIRYVNFERTPEARPGISGYDGLVILGGPMNADEDTLYPHLAYEKKLITEAIGAGIAVLGICLGAQLIARALGAKVHRKNASEIGWHPLSLTADGRADPLMSRVDCAAVFQWHEDSFEIPEGAVRLASTRACENQAFRYGSKTYGLQFHLEVDAAIIERWLKKTQNRREMNEHGIDPAQIVEQTAGFIDASIRASETCFQQWIELLGRPNKRKALGSGHS